MPELPEVESLRRQLDPELSGRRAEDVWFDPHPNLRREFVDLEALIGRTIERVGRRGKFLIAPLDRGLELVMHLGMTGAFRFDFEDPYVRARVWLDDGRVLAFRDVRRFGRMAVVRAGEYGDIPMLATLGPEPLSDEFDADRFARLLAATRGPVKPYLLTQRPVAGISDGGRGAGPKRLQPVRLRTISGAVPPLLDPVSEDRPRRPQHDLLPSLPASLRKVAAEQDSVYRARNHSGSRKLKRSSGPQRDGAASNCYRCPSRAGSAVEWAKSVDDAKRPLGCGLQGSLEGGPGRVVAGHPVNPTSGRRR
jgi:hypothetical protein